jgi:phage terminase small subunit
MALFYGNRRLLLKSAGRMLYNAFMSETELPKLSPKHQVFVNKYLELWNATRAYMAAYPAVSETTARTNGSLLLVNTNIQAHIRARLNELHMSADEALARMTDIAKARITDFYTGDGNDLDLSLFDTDIDGNLVPKQNTGLIKRIKIKRSSTQFGESVETELELHNSQRAQEKILELNGRFGNLTKEPVSGGSRADTVPFYLPADVIAPSFFASYRAVKSGKYYEFCEYGGRGSTKSSFISLAIIELIKNNPTTHALVMRQVAATLRDSVFAQLR